MLMRLGIRRCLTRPMVELRALSRPSNLAIAFGLRCSIRTILSHLDLNPNGSKYAPRVGIQWGSTSRNLPGLIIRHVSTTASHLTTIQPPNKPPIEHIPHDPLPSTTPDPHAPTISTKARDEKSISLEPPPPFQIIFFFLFLCTNCRIKKHSHLNKTLGGEGRNCMTRASHWSQRPG